MSRINDLIMEYKKEKDNYELKSKAYFDFISSKLKKRGPNSTIVHDNNGNNKGIVNQYGLYIELNKDNLALERNSNLCNIGGNPIGLDTVSSEYINTDDSVNKDQCHFYNTNIQSSDLDSYTAKNLPSEYSCYLNDNSKSPDIGISGSCPSLQDDEFYKKCASKSYQSGKKFFGISQNIDGDCECYTYTNDEKTNLTEKDIVLNTITVDNLTKSRDDNDSKAAEMFVLFMNGEGHFVDTSNYNDFYNYIYNYDGYRELGETLTITQSSDTCHKLVGNGVHNLKITTNCQEV